MTKNLKPHMFGLCYGVTEQLWLTGPQWLLSLCIASFYDLLAIMLNEQYNGQRLHAGVVTEPRLTTTPILVLQSLMANERL